MKEHDGMARRSLARQLFEQRVEKLITTIQEEEMILGTAREWTPFQIERLSRIRKLRSALPQDKVVPTRGHLGELFHLPNTEEGQKDFDLQFQEGRV